MLHIIIRCVACHRETEATAISLEHWPVLEWPKPLLAKFCWHRIIEARLVETVKKDYPRKHGVVEPEKGGA
jgi:hypothetical protein